MHSRSQYWPDVLVAEIPLHGKLPSPAAACTVFTTITCSNFLSHRTPVFKNETSFCQYITSSQAHTSLFWIKPHPPPSAAPGPPSLSDGPPRTELHRRCCCVGGEAKGRREAWLPSGPRCPFARFEAQQVWNHSSLPKACPELHGSLYSILLLNTFKPHWLYHCCLIICLRCKRVSERRRVSDTLVSGRLSVAAVS